MVDVTGPDGQEAHFGLWTPVYTRAGAAYLASVGVAAGIVPVCDYTDPESALKVLATNLGKANGTNWTYKQGLGQAAAPFMPGKAAYLVFDADVTRNGKTVTVRSLALIDMIPTRPGPVGVLHLRRRLPGRDVRQGPADAFGDLEIVEDGRPRVPGAAAEGRREHEGDGPHPPGRERLPSARHGPGGR